MIGFISMDNRIVFVKCLFKGVRPEPVEFAEPFANKSIKRRVRPFLRTTLDDHEKKGRKSISNLLKLS